MIIIGFANSSKAYAPKVYENALLSLEHSNQNSNNIYLNNSYFENCPNISFDYAVMENSRDAIMVELNMDWCDLGTIETYDEFHSNSKL